MFDRVELAVRAGNGGDGSISFRREKFVSFGGPDGGDGGKGGAVIISANPNLTDLRGFKHRRFYKAANGKNGGSRRKKGKKGDDLVLMVPVGTVVLRKEQNGNASFFTDLMKSGQQVVVAKGGMGGMGNTHFTSSTNQAPQIAQRGEVGEENEIILELKLIADVGVIGFPSVGKSTLLAVISAARPKIAEYPFTTLEPVLGMVRVGHQDMVLAEIPGLIDGAHKGRGLGHDFLRHIVRTKILIHMVDGTSVSPVEDMIRVNEELELFDSALLQKPQVVVVNKVDLATVRSRLTEMRAAFSSAGFPVHFISAANEEGISELTSRTMQLLGQVATKVEGGVKAPVKVFRPLPKGTEVKLKKEGDTFVLVAPEMERFFTRAGGVSSEVSSQLKRQITKLGVDRVLEKAGIKPGDKIRCGNIEWEW
jgi:GTP-binding protein